MCPRPALCTGLGSSVALRSGQNAPSRSTSSSVHSRCITSSPSLKAATRRSGAVPGMFSLT